MTAKPHWTNFVLLLIECRCQPLYFDLSQFQKDLAKATILLGAFLGITFVKACSGTLNSGWLINFHLLTWYFECCFSTLIPVTTNLLNGRQELQLTFWHLNSWSLDFHHASTWTHGERYLCFLQFLPTYALEWDCVLLTMTALAIITHDVTLTFLWFDTLTVPWEWLLS